MTTPDEPTAEQCSNHDEVPGGFACWYPQMGGYVGKCVIISRKGHDDCFEAYVWHDGEFPFSEDDPDKSPAHIHHCDAEQFIRFGEQLVRWQT